MKRITEVQAQGPRGGLDDGEEEDWEDHQLLTQGAALMASMNLFTGPLLPGPPLCAPSHCSQRVLSNGQVCKSDESTHVHKHCGSSSDTGNRQQPGVQCPSM